MKKILPFVPSLVNFFFCAIVLLIYHFNKEFFNYHYSAKYFFHCIAFAFLLVGATNVLTKKFYVLNVNVAILAVLWLLLELGYTKSLSTEKYPSESLFNKPCSVFDPVRGYKWSPDSDVRCVRYGNGTVIFDQIFHVNNMGYISRYDYHYKKNGSTKFRWIVFGDSFTAGEDLETPWCDRMNQFASEKELNMEFYSFGIDGGGIENWHSVFFNEVLPNYEFDGVIVAAFYENFKRDFIVNVTIDTMIYFGYFKSAPSNKMDIDNNWIYENRFSAGWKISPDSLLNERLKSISVKQSSKVPFYFAALNKLYQKLLSINYKRKTQIDKNENIETSIKLSYSEEKLQKMNNLFASIKQNRKRILLATVPAKNGITHNTGNTKQQKNLHQQEFQYFANKYNLEFFDSYPEFQRINPDSIETYFLKYDWHWSQQGSDYFANSFYNYLTKNNP